VNVEPVCPSSADARQPMRFYVLNHAQAFYIDSSVSYDIVIHSVASHPQFRRNISRSSSGSTDEQNTKPA
jgi:hypothetical protein